MKVGPDAARYWHAGGRGRVPRPFHLRWLLPRLCEQQPDRWWAAWLAGWALAAVGMFSLAAQLHGWQVGVAATCLLLGLPGFLGPPVTMPIGVDIPATGLGLCAAALTVNPNPGWVFLAVVLSLAAGAAKETTPLFAALWAWHWLPLVGLVAPLVAHLAIRPGPDPLGPKFQAIADHPVRSALDAHKGRWRDAWLMVAPWGVCLAALVGADWRLVVVLAVAYAQLVVATDTVRLVHHAAGPAMALAAALVVPVEWLPLAVVAHVFWWFKVERV